MERQLEAKIAAGDPSAKGELEKVKVAWEKQKERWAQLVVEGEKEAAKREKKKMLNGGKKKKAKCGDDC